MFCEDKDISGHTISETNNKIIEIVKFNSIAFTNSSVFSSELYSAFLSNKVSDRLVIFENILSLKEITSFYVTTKEIIKEFTDKRNEEKTILTSIEAEANALNSTLEAYNNNARSKLLELKSKKESANANIDEAEKKIREYSIINIDEEKQKVNNSNIKKEIEEQINDLNKEKERLFIKEPQDELAIFNKYKGVNFEENELKEKKYKEDLELINQRENGYKEEMNKISSLNEKKGNLTKELNSNKSEIIENERKKEKLEKAECPFCGQHLSSETSEKELSKINERISSLKKSDEEIEKEIKEIETKFDEAKENYDYLLSDYNRIKDNLDKNFIPNSQLVYEQFLAAQKRIVEVEEERAKNSKRIIMKKKK